MIVYAWRIHFEAPVHLCKTKVKIYVGNKSNLPVIGQIPPLAKVAAITAWASGFVSSEHNWK